MVRLRKGRDRRRELFDGTTLFLLCLGFRRIGHLAHIAYPVSFLVLCGPRHGFGQKNTVSQFSPPPTLTSSGARKNGINARHQRFPG